MPELKKKEPLDTQFSAFMGTKEMSDSVDSIMAESGASYSEVMRYLIQLGLESHKRLRR